MSLVRASHAQLRSVLRFRLRSMHSSPMPLVQSKAISPAAAGLGGPLRPQCGPFVADTVVGRCYSDLAPPPDTHGRSGQDAPAEDKSLSRMREASLPKQPVPNLRKTLDMYLTLLTPVVSSEQLEVSRQHVQQLLVPGGWGDKLQDYLLKRHEDTDNWSVDWRLDERYLSNPKPLPVYSSPVSLFPQQHFSDTQQMLWYASKVVCGFLDYKDMLEIGLPVEVVDGHPVSMEQYYRIFSTCRRPGLQRDALLTSLGRHSPPYIVVVCRGQFYKVDLEVDGVKLNEKELQSQLSFVLTSAVRDSDGEPSVGLLTACNRPFWAEAWARLASDGRNSGVLNTIENCMVILCLDKTTMTSSSTLDQGPDAITNSVNNLLQGHGTAFNSCNRWYDKTLQIVVSEDGTCGTICEHSPVDAHSNLSASDHALAYLVVRDRLDFSGVTFKEFGGNLPKHCGVSPDAVVQLALQLAYYMNHGQLAVTCENVSLRRFYKGRSNYVQSNSPAALAWIQAMLGEVTVPISAGHSSENHLQGLHRAAVELGVLDQIPFFSSPSFHNAFRYRLGTSQVPHTLAKLTLYGPDQHDGYGANYRLHDHILFGVTSFAQCADTDTQQFVTSLRSGLCHMRDLCLQQGH